MAASRACRSETDGIRQGDRIMSVRRDWKRAGLALVLAAGWSYREITFAQGACREVPSGTYNLGQVEMKGASDKGQPVGEIGVYLAGDTPASSKFVTGRFVLPPGKTPHDPHTHAEEEVMIIERGHGEIF